MERIIKSIPSALTLSNLACGFAAIMTADLYWSSILLMWSYIFDALDGFVARKLNATSEFGKELDSLADIVSFGAAPAYLYYLIAPDQELLSLDGALQFDTGLLCRIAPIFLVLAGAIRLAKFNTLPSLPYFKGLPIPANGLFFIGIIFAFQNNSELVDRFLSNDWNYILLPVIFSILMVSFNIKMFSSKGLSKDWSKNIFHVALVIISILILLFFKIESLSLIIIAYVLLSIGYHFMTLNHELDKNL